MRISYQWLKELLPGLKASPEEVARRLTDAGLEVESIEDKGLAFKGVVVGEVLSLKKHPNADRLSICQVTDGKKTYPVVCGASNVQKGKKYPLALIFTILPNGAEIKKATIRGIESEGMLCSAKELNLSEEASGILQLDDKAPLGKSFASAYGLDDTILEIAVTPNRGDCLSHWGIAREVASLFGLPSFTGKVPLIKGSYDIKSYLKVYIKDPNGCPRYCSRVIRGVTVGPSPRWLSLRLKSLGIRAINNIVDATNYVMMETGQPLHAFDHRLVYGGKIVVKKAGDCSLFKTLDGEEQRLDPSDLVIADAQKPIALAGIMGGANSEIGEDASVIVLEAASFDPGRIRQTARRLGLQTESSYRFERGVFPVTSPFALERLTTLVLELAGGEASHDRIDVYPRKQKRKSILLRRGRLDKLLGVSLPSSEVSRWLGLLGFLPKKKKQGWQAKIPPFRADLEREIDLIEEVVRLAGFNRIPSHLPQSVTSPIHESLESSLEDEISSFFVSRGFCETVHLSFAQASEEGMIRLSNPLSEGGDALRTSLFPALLQALDRNRKQGISSFRFFELRKVYTLPRFEKLKLAGIYGGPLFEKNWQKLAREMDFFDGKSLLEDLCLAGKTPPLQFLPEKINQKEFHPNLSMRLLLGGNDFGFFGEVHPTIRQQLELGCPLYYFDLDYSLLVDQWGKGAAGYQSFSPYPAIVRDLALLADARLKNEEILSFIKECQVPWLKSVRLFDLYLGDELPKGKKSLTYSLVYEAGEKTLTDEEVNQSHFKLVEMLRMRLGVGLR